MISNKMSAKSTRPAMLALCLGTLLAARAPSAAAEPDPWNPQPASDDVLLPAPCDGTVAFRKIATGDATGDPLKSILDDRRVVLGRAADETGYVEYSRIDYVSGAFVDPAAGKRYFLLGKYEVSEGLFRGVMSDGADCRKDFDAALPKTDLSWFEAVEFTRRYSAWLYGHHLDALPSFQDTPGYVRLPTETEWEYAARGGLSVSETDFQKNVFAPDGQLQAYAWYNSPDSADGELQQIGSTEQPNPLGLFDMLGNASEMVLDSFRLNRAGRQHGQIGGFVAKGGSIDTPADALRSSMREERAYFSAESKNETRAASMGFRVAISGVSMPDLRSINAIKEEWVAAGGKRDLSDDPMEALRALSAEQADPSTKQALDSIRQQITRANTLQNDLEGRMLRNLLYSLTSMHGNLARLLSLYNQLTEQEAYYRSKQAAAVSDQELQDYEGRLAGVEQRKERAAGEFLDIGEVYVELLTQTTSEFTPEQTADQIRTLHAELLERRRESLSSVVTQLARVLLSDQSTRNLSKIEILERAFGRLNFYQAR